MKRAIFVHTDLLGRVGIAEAEGAIANVFFGATVAPKDWTEAETPLLRRAADELAEYLAGMRRDFDLPLAPEGTAFQRAVWAALCAIPYGQTRAYADIARAIGRPTACRAVGRANGLNPISIFIPCHRVLGSNGALTGYAGGLAAKQALLDLERGTYDRHGEAHRCLAK